MKNFIRKYKRQVLFGSGIFTVLCAVLCTVFFSMNNSENAERQQMSEESVHLAQVAETEEIHSELQSQAQEEETEQAAEEEALLNENVQESVHAPVSGKPDESVQTAAQNLGDEVNRSGGIAKSVEVNRGNSSAKEIGDVSYLGTFRTTAYCACESCSEGWGNQTATGVPARPNRTIAVDPKVIKLGTRVVIDGKEYVAEDTGGAIKGNKIDIYFANHAEAMQFGVRSKEVYLAK